MRAKTPEFTRSIRNVYEWSDSKTAPLQPSAVHKHRLEIYSSLWRQEFACFIVRLMGIFNEYERFKCAMRKFIDSVSSFLFYFYKIACKNGKKINYQNCKIKLKYFSGGFEQQHQNADLTQKCNFTTVSFIFNSISQNLFPLLPIRTKHGLIS